MDKIVITSAVLVTFLSFGTPGPVSSRPETRDWCYVSQDPGEVPAMNCFATKSECNTALQLLPSLLQPPDWATRCVDGEKVVMRYREGLRP